MPRPDRIARLPRWLAAPCAAALLMLFSLAAAKPENAADPANPAKRGLSLSDLKPAPPRSGPMTTQPRLEDWIAEPGSTQKFQPFMLHADKWEGIDQRAKLDSVVYVLENGARACKVLSRDSTWAVDYTWVYPHNLLPPRWYDAKALFAAGDSLHLPDDADLKLTFGTLRTAVHAGSFEQAKSEAHRLWPAQMPPALAGRLKLKLERAQKVIDAEASAASKGR